MLSNLDFDAQLIVSANNVPFVVVAQENYFIVNFPDFNSLDAILKMGKGVSGNNAAPKTNGKKSLTAPLKKLQEINDKIRELGLVIDIRVANKTYVELGSGRSARITAAAILGKLGSFFGK